MKLRVAFAEVQFHGSSGILFVDGTLMLMMFTDCLRRFKVLDFLKCPIVIAPVAEPHAQQMCCCRRVGSGTVTRVFSPKTSLHFAAIPMKRIFAVSATFYLLLQCNSFKMVQESLEESWGKKDPDYQDVLKCRQDEEERLKRQNQESGFLGVFGDILGTACGGGGGGRRRRRKRLLLMENSEGLGEDIGQNMSQDLSQDLQSNASTQFIFAALAVGCAVAGPVTDIASGFVDRQHEKENMDATNCDRMMADLTLRKLDELDEKVDKGFKDVKANIDSLESKMDAQHRAMAIWLNNIATLEAEGQLKTQTLVQKEVMQEMKALGKDTALLSAKLDQERLQGKREKTFNLFAIVYYIVIYCHVLWYTMRGGTFPESVPLL